MIAPQTPKAVQVGVFGGEELGEAGVVGEVAGDEGDVDVAALADRFAVVEGFKDGEEAGVFLGQAGEGVEVLRALVGGEFGPFRLGAAGGCDGAWRRRRRCLG